MKSILLLMLIPALFFAQIKKIITKDGEIFEISEIGGIVIKESDKLKVDMVMPSENRNKIYKDVDVIKGDLVLMMNGKKVDDVSAAKEIYEKLKPGEEIKLGIQRGQQMFITRLKKADPKDLPKVKRIVIRDIEEGTVFLPEEGLLIGPEKNKTIIKKKLPRSENNLKEGDQLIEVNGKKIKSSDEFSSIYKSLKTGEKLQLKFKSGETLTTTKAADNNKMIIKTDKK